MHDLIGTTAIDWRDGMRRMARTFDTDLVG